MFKAFAFAIVVTCASICHAAVTVDGNLSDWGITVKTGSTVATMSTYASVPGVVSMIEDTDDTAGDGGAVGPLFGGQNYDAEFLGAIVENNMLKIGIMSGQRMDNGLPRYEPGDIFIKIGSTMYAIEVGGGTGDTSVHSGVIGLGSTGSTYNLDGSGFTSTVSNPGHTAGSIWTDPGLHFIDGIAAPPPSQFDGGTPNFNGNADSYFFTWNNNANDNQHSFIEVGISLSKLQPGEATIYWSPSCGNDTLNVTLNLPPSNIGELPEPISLAIWSALAGIGSIYSMRKRRK